MNLNILLKLGNLICAYADFEKFIYKTLDICSQTIYIVITLIIIIIIIIIHICIQKYV